MLLTANFERGLFDEIPFEIEIQIFDVRRDFELWISLLRCNVLGNGQDFFCNVVFNDALFGQHQHMGFINIKNGLVGTSQIGCDCWTNQVIDDFFGGCFFDFSSLTSFSHNNSPQCG